MDVESNSALKLNLIVQAARSHGKTLEFISAKQLLELGPNGNPVVVVLESNLGSEEELAVRALTEVGRSITLLLANPEITVTEDLIPLIISPSNLESFEGDASLLSTKAWAEVFSQYPDLVNQKFSVVDVNQLKDLVFESEVVIVRSLGQIEVSSARWMVSNLQKTRFILVTNASPDNSVSEWLESRIPTLIIESLLDTGTSLGNIPNKKLTQWTAETDISWCGKEDEEDQDLGTFSANGDLPFALMAIGMSLNTRGIAPFDMNWEDSPAIPDGSELLNFPLDIPKAEEFAQVFGLDFKDESEPTFSLNQNVAYIPVNTPLGHKSSILIIRTKNGDNPVLRVLVPILESTEMPLKNPAMFQGACHWILRKIQALALNFLGLADDENPAIIQNIWLGYLQSAGINIDSPTSDSKVFSDPFISGMDTYGNLFPGLIDLGARRVGYTVKSKQRQNSLDVSIGWEIPLNSETMFIWTLFGHRAVLAIADIVEESGIKSELHL